MTKHFHILLSLLLVMVSGCHQDAIKKEDKVRQKIVYLKKMNDDLVSFCKCGDGHITYPPQLNCPWCGCGWLFACIQCRKAFTFAVGVEIKASWEELARRDITNRQYKPLTDSAISQWIETMKRLLADVKTGKVYVCLDGRVFEKDAENVEFEGWYARHSFKQLPHVTAMRDISVIERILGNEVYWKSHAKKYGTQPDDAPNVAQIGGDIDELTVMQTKRIDSKALKPISKIKNKKVRELANEAEDFLISHPWCKKILEGYIAWGIADVIGVFLFKIQTYKREIDEMLWVVAGDLPPAYLVTDDAKNWQEALDGYVYEMKRWVEAVRSDKGIEDLIPVNAEPTLEYAEMLPSRLKFIEENFIKNEK